MQPDDDLFLTPAARRRELARIFAAGILRLHIRGALAADSDDDRPPENLPESGRSRLEVPPKTVLSDTRVNGFREPRTRSIA